MLQDDDIPGIVRYHTYEVLKEEVNNPRLRWAYLPYSMHMAGPREAIQHMIIRKNYGRLPLIHDSQQGRFALCAGPQCKAHKMLCMKASRETMVHSLPVYAS